MLTSNEVPAPAVEQTATAPTDSSRAAAPAERRHRQIVVIAGSFLVFALTALLVPLPFRNRAWEEIADLLHIPAFGMINYLALTIVTYHFPSRWRVPLLVTGAVIALGAGIEVMQGILSRNASLGDVLRNALGASAALLIHQSMRLEYPRRLGWSLRSFAALFIAAGVLPPGLALLDMYAQHRQFPVIASFNSRAELQRWYIGSAQVNVRLLPWPGGRSTARVTFLPGEYPAVRLMHMHRDWTQHEALVTELTHSPESKSERVLVQVRISKQKIHPIPKRSFAKVFEIQRGESVEIRIPLDDVRRGPAEGELPLDWIGSVEFTALQLSEPATVEISPILLEASPSLAARFAP
jgi:VanZ family protein